jgi:hypothetical protein
MSIANAINGHEEPIATNGASDNNTPAANTNAVITLAAPGAGKVNVISGVAWSYSGNPTGGRLKIEDVSGTIVFDIDIITGGPGFIPFVPPKKNAAANTALIITLFAGGGTIQGKVNVLGAWTESSTGV